jgi:signal transduction histidine kinase
MRVEIVLLPAITFMVTAALLGYVLSQRSQSSLRPGIIATCGATLAWIGGMLLATLAPIHHPLASLGVIVHFAGVCAVTSAFALVGMRFARFSLVEQNPHAMMVALSVPSALCFSVVLTNPWHGLFGGPMDGSIFTSTTVEWRGPLYPALVTWVYMALGSSLILCARRAASTRDQEERHKLVAICASAGVPLLGYAMHDFGWLPLPENAPVATLSLTASVLAVVLGITRFGFLETHYLPLRSVIDYLDDALMLANLDGIVVEVNPAAAKLLDRERRDLVGATLADVLESVGVAQHLYSNLRVAARSERRSHRLVGSRGQTIDMSFGWVRGKRGDPIGCFVVLGDRTEQQNYQRLRHRTQRLESMGVLLAGLAHEINNPLAFVRANLGHLANQLSAWSPDAEEGAKATPDVDELRDVVKDSLEGLDRIATVVASTRKLAPREDSAPFGPVDLSALIQDTAAMAVRYTDAGTQLKFSLPPEAPLVLGCANRLSQVFLNLVVNACQAVPGPDGRIQIAIRGEEERIEIVLQDNGPGVAEAIRDRIFDPFFTTKDPDIGMGLGLSIVHDTVSDHDGDVALVESDLGGAGFRIRLPRFKD